jgi:type IV secretion system protein VirD4
MKLTPLLLLAATGAAIWVYIDPSVVSVLVGAVCGWLAVRWIRRRPKPRLEKAREFARPRAASAKTVVRRGDRARRQHGLASAAEVRRHGSARTVRKLATTVRPSLAELGPVARVRRVRTREVGVRLCRVGRQTVWASVEDVVLFFAGPRRGKSGWMASTVIDYPGPVVVTTTRTDLWTNTHQHRAKTGQVWVFNAAGITNMDNEVTFDPLTDCASPEVATERAADMIPTATGEQEHWAALARSALAALMHAAALGELTMDEVARWVADPAEHKAAVIKLLRRSPVRRAMVDHALQFLDNNDRTRSSITTSMVQALRWLQAPHARAAAGLEGDRRPFTVDALLSGRHSLYVLGRAEDHTAPLMSALTGYVARNARRTAAGGRLDPPLGLQLDEAAQLKPPLPEWSSDMGGFGITIVAAFQSRAQLISAWGVAGAGIILNNAGSIMLGGGTKDPNDLETWSNLAGKRDERTETTDGSGKVTSSSQRQVAVLPPSELANLAPKQVVVFHHGMLPALGRVRMVWERWDLRLLPAVVKVRGWISTSTTSPLPVEPQGVVEVGYIPSTSSTPSPVVEGVEQRV